MVTTSPPLVSAPITARAGLIRYYTTDLAAIVQNAVANGSPRLRLHGDTTFDVKPALIDTAPEGSFPLTIEGDGPSTVLEFSSDTPLYVSIPSITGFPNRIRIATEVIGLFFRSSRSVWNRLKVCGLAIRAPKHSMAAAGHYVGIMAAGHNIEFSNITVLNDQSTDGDLTAISPLKGQSKRNITSWTAFQIGDSRWINPNPELAQTCDGVTVRDIRGFGEPLETTSGATNTACLFRLRKCINVDVSDVKMGEWADNEERLISDVIFAGQPSDGDIVTVNDFDPFTRRTNAVVYEFDSNASVTAGRISVTIGASLTATMANFVEAVNVRRAGSNATGTQFHEALQAANYIPGATAATGGVRIRQYLAVDSYSEGTPVSNLGTVQSSSYVTETGTNLSVRTIANGRDKRGYWLYGMVLEDTFLKSVHGVTLGSDYALRTHYLSVATLPHLDFDPVKSSENGHESISNFRSENTRGKIIDIRDGGFSQYDESILLGVCATDALESPVMHVRAGTHKAFRYALTSSNAANGYTVTIDDDVNDAAVFTFRAKAGKVVTFSTVPEPTAGAFACLKVKPTGHAPIRVKFDLGTHANDPDERLYWIDVTGLNTTQTASAFDDLLDTVFGSDITTTDSTNTVTVQDNSYGSGALLVVEELDPGNDISIATYQVNSADTGIEDSVYDVPLGASSRESCRNLREKIFLAVQRDHDLLVYVDDPTSASTATMDITFFTFDEHGAAPAVTESGANSSVTNISTPYRNFGFKWNPTVHWPATVNNFQVPALRAEGVAGHIELGGRIYHLNAGALTTSSYPTWNVQIAALPTLTGNICTITPQNGATATFAYNLGTDGTPANTYYVDPTVYTDIGGVAYGLAISIRKNLGIRKWVLTFDDDADTGLKIKVEFLSGRVDYFESNASGVDAPNHFYFNPGANATATGDALAAKMNKVYETSVVTAATGVVTVPDNFGPDELKLYDITEVTDSDTDLVISFIPAVFATEQLSGALALMTITEGLLESHTSWVTSADAAFVISGTGLGQVSDGNTDTTVGGESFPVVLSDCHSVDIDGAHFSDYRTSIYDGSNPPNFFPGVYNLTNLDPMAAMGGAVVKPLLITRSATHDRQGSAFTGDATFGRPHVSIRNLFCGGAFGTPLARATHPLYELGANTTKSDIAVAPASSYCNGFRV